MRISDISIKNPVMAWMIMIFLIVFGVISFNRLGISQYPDIDFPNVNISANLDGAPPEIIENTVIQPLEDVLTSIEGVKRMSSTSRSGSGSVTLEFDIDRNIDSAIQEVQTKVGQAMRRLPEGMEQPTVSKSNPEDQPIVWISVSSDTKPRRDVMKFAQQYVKDEFTSINGVGDVVLMGFIDPIVKIQVIPFNLKKYNITIQDVIDSIQDSHKELPSGQIDTSDMSFSLRLKGEVGGIDEFKNIIITKRAGQNIQDYSNKIRLKDVATVSFDLADAKRTARFKQNPSITVGVKKQRGTNSVLVTKEVKAKVQELKTKLPEGYKIDIAFDTAQFIEHSIKELTTHLMVAVLFTALVCWIFLGSYSATFNILLSIPTSICGTFIVLYFLGFTLNTFTLLGLTLSIGIVVDDAIMVLENIFRNSELNKPRIEASIVGAREITFAAIAATAAIVAIFLPVAFMNGIVGKYFLQFGVTISVAVLFSLLEALTITPMRSSYLSQSTERTTRIGKALDAFFSRLTHLYAKTLSACVAHPWKTLLVSISLSAISFLLIKFIPKEFSPPQQSGMVFANVQLPTGTPFAVTDGVMKKVESWLAKEGNIDRYSMMITGESNRANVIIGFKPRSEMTMSQLDYIPIIRKNLTEITKGRVSVSDPTSRSPLSGGGRGFAIEFMIKGNDWDGLSEQAEVLMKKLEDSKILVDVDTNLSYGLPEIQIVPDRDKASSHGVTVTQIARTVNALISGYKVAQYTEDGKRYDIVASLAKTDNQEKDLENIFVSNARGNFIPLSKIVKFEKKKTLQQINRVDRSKSVTFYANLAPGVKADKAWSAVQKIVKDNLKEGFYLETYGATQAQDETFSSLIFALALGILVAYMILASQYNSFLDPITVLIVLPFSLSGVFLGLIITNQTINLYSMIGTLLLMGIVKKNSILLVDFANQDMLVRLSEAGKAMMNAGEHRFRPILMTSLATIAGAIPSAMGTGPGSELSRAMAVTIIFGVLVATFFTLYAVPALYVKLDKLKTANSRQKDVKNAFIAVGSEGLGE